MKLKTARSDLMIFLMRKKINDSLSQLSGLVNSYEEIKNQIKICLNDLDGTSLADKANEIKEEFNEIDGNINEIASAQMDSDADEIDRLNQRLLIWVKSEENMESQLKKS